VVAYDLDPQQTLSDVAEVRREEGYTPPLQVNQPRENMIDDMQYHSKKTQVLVDVGASNMEAMKQALSIANRIIIPVPPSQPDVWATQRFLSIVNDLDSKHKAEIHVFVNRADTHSAVKESDETEEVLAQLPGVSLIPQRLYQRTVYRRSLSEGMSIFEISRRSKAIDEFNRLAEILYPELDN
jgi:chromosome partitioning protein